MSFTGIVKLNNIKKRDKMIATEGVELPEGHIANVQDSYKYFGNHEETTRKLGTVKYLCTVSVVRFEPSTPMPCLSSDTLLV